MHPKFANRVTCVCGGCMCVKHSAVLFRSRATQNQMSLIINFIERIINFQPMERINVGLKFM